MAMCSCRSQESVAMMVTLSSDVSNRVSKAAGAMAGSGGRDVIDEWAHVPKHLLNDLDDDEDAGAGAASAAALHRKDMQPAPSASAAGSDWREMDVPEAAGPRDEESDAFPSRHDLAMWKTLSGDPVISRVGAANDGERADLAMVLALQDFEAFFRILPQNGPETGTVQSPHTAAVRRAFCVAASRSLRYYHGHLVMMPLRGLGRGAKAHSQPYKKIVIDVADKLCEGFTFLSWTSFRTGDAATAQDVENVVWASCEARVRRKIASLNVDGKLELEAELRSDMRMRGFGDMLGAGRVVGGVLTGMIAELLIAELIVGTVGSRAMLGALGAEAGTGVGIAVVVVTLLAVLQGPSYSKSVPAVIQLIAIRKRLEREAFLAEQAAAAGEGGGPAEGHGLGTLDLGLAGLDLGAEIGSYTSVGLAETYRVAAQTLRTKNTGRKAAGAGGSGDGKGHSQAGPLVARLGILPWFARDEAVDEALEDKASISSWSCDDLRSVIDMLVFAASRREAIIKAAPAITDAHGTGNPPGTYANLWTRVVEPTLSDSFDRAEVWKALRPDDPESDPPSGDGFGHGASS